jgi:hypothetical protein
MKVAQTKVETPDATNEEEDEDEDRRSAQAQRGCRDPARRLSNHDLCAP